MSRYASSSCSAEVTSPSFPPPLPSPPPAPAASMSAWRYATVRARPLVKGIGGGEAAPFPVRVEEIAAAALSAFARPACVEGGIRKHPQGGLQ